jgi:hypothetical protein
MSLLDYPLSNPPKIQSYTPAPRNLFRSAVINLNKFRFRKKNNSPFISGDSIASLTDYYVYGESGSENLDIEKLMGSNSIFVNSDKLCELLREITNKPIKTKVLVTGNSDFNFTKKYSLPKSFNLWLCQNNAMPKSKNVFTLPIGIENLRLGRLGQQKWYRPHNSNAIENKILVPPMSPTNMQRLAAINFAVKNPSLFAVYTQYLNESRYFELTRNYRFVLCCEGNGFENHRIWETLYQGSFPILINSKWADSLRYLKLPLLIVDSLNDLNEYKLQKFLSSNIDFEPKNSPQLWISFWKDLINKYSE